MNFETNLQGKFFEFTFSTCTPPFPPASPEKESVGDKKTTLLGRVKGGGGGGMS